MSGEGFADAVVEVLREPEGARRAAARALAERYPWSRTVASMLDVHAGAVTDAVPAGAMA